ncbi:MAG TPA: glycosyltransferase family 4 protein [Marmoricola sp.]|nr:glycosyltransferase family 4 protein [Marmoricola sp.]
MSSTSDLRTRPRRAPARARVAVVVSGWPRLSETFALNELVALHRAGLLAAVLATKPGESGLRHPAVAELAPWVTVLRDGTAAQQAAEVADRVVDLGVTSVHGYFAHRPAEVAAAAAQLLRVPYGFSVHALDARKVSPSELAARAAGASVVIACNRDAAATLAAVGASPRLLPHGVDLDTFAPTPPPTLSASDRPVELLAVGRFVEKKGFATLLEALRRVHRDVHLGLVGDGPLRSDLVARARELRLGSRLTIEPRLAHDALPGRYADADVVVVPSVVDWTGDRDGLPNVVLESMASGRPVIATTVGAIASGVRDGETGLLVPPRDPDALAAAITELVDRPDLRVAFGLRARAIAEEQYDLATCAATFCEVLGGVHV